MLRLEIMPQFASAELFVLCELLVAVPRPITGYIEYLLVSQVVFNLATSAVYLFILLFRNVVSCAR